MSKFSNLAVKNAAYAAKAAMKNGFDEKIFEAVFEETLAAEPDENFKTGTVYDAYRAR